jgi:hypothetical protein
MKEIVHNRDLSIRTYDCGDQVILIEGRLIDHRYRWDKRGGSNTPRPVHDMVVRLKVRGPEMIIEEAEAQMPLHPREGCEEVIPWIKKLEGMKIATGFTLKVKELIGDTKGCAHLTSLVIAMGPAAVQGYWAAYGIDSSRLSLNKEAIRKVVNTCYLWRGDGPLVKKLLEAIEPPLTSDFKK